MSPPGHFDPDSTDSMFATILTRLDSIDKRLEQTECFQSDCRHGVNTRISALESELTMAKGKVLGGMAVGSALSGLVAWIGTLWAMRK